MTVTLHGPADVTIVPFPSPPEEAARAYDAAAREIHASRAKCNFPLGPDETPPPVSVPVSPPCDDPASAPKATEAGAAAPPAAATAASKAEPPLMEMTSPAPASGPSETAIPVASPSRAVQPKAQVAAAGITSESGLPDSLLHHGIDSDSFKDYSLIFQACSAEILALP